MSLGIALDVGIGLILMYLILSLLVMAINELVAQFGTMRAKHLQSALRRILDLKARPQDKENLLLFDAVMSSPTLQIAGAISKTTWSSANPLPSYIQRETFLAALREAVPKLAHLKTLANANGTPVNIESVQDIATLIEALPHDSRVKSALKAAIGGAAATAQEVEQRVGDWFDGMMERATGAYKRWMSTASMIVGLALAIGLNCDTIRVADALAKSAELRAQIAKVADDVVQRCTGADGQPHLAADDCTVVRKNLNALQALPIGGNREFNLPSIFGWLITAFAVTLGAPFWFDILSKIMNVRSSFKRKDALTGP